MHLFTVSYYNVFIFPRNVVPLHQGGILFSRQRLVTRDTKLNTRRWSIVGVMLYHWPRRRPNDKPLFCQCVVLSGHTSVTGKMNLLCTQWSCPGWFTIHHHYRGGDVAWWVYIELRQQVRDKQYQHQNSVQVSSSDWSKYSINQDQT